MLSAAADFWSYFRGVNEPRERISLGSSATSGAAPGCDGDSGEPTAKKPKTDGWIFYIFFYKFWSKFTIFFPTQNRLKLILSL